MSNLLFIICDPISYVSHVSSLLQPFLFVVGLTNSSNGTHFVTNVFENISVTVTYLQGCPIYIIFYNVSDN